MVIERRLQPRIEISGPVSLLIAGQTAPAELMNINATGVQLELSADTIESMRQYRTEDGSWPVVRLYFGNTLAAPEFASTGLGCEMVFSRRLNQKQYVGGFRFVTPDIATREAVITLVRNALKAGTA